MRGIDGTMQLEIGREWGVFRCEACSAGEKIPYEKRETPHTARLLIHGLARAGGWKRRHDMRWYCPKCEGKRDSARARDKAECGR